ncbi:MAG: stage V sporulation protein AA [Eubacterium sp.]
MSDTLYIKMDQSVELTKSEVTVADIAKLECKNKNVLNKLKPIKLLTDDSNGKKRYIVSVMKILEIVDETFQNVDVQSLGETECVVEFKKAQTGKQYLDIIKTIAICFILFFGVGFSIMSFNNDIGVDDMFGQICELFAGSKEEGKQLIELCYSIGLGVGIMIFYNHFGPKKLSKDPTPIEVEMRKYETDINQTLIDGHNRQDGKLDVK